MIDPEVRETLARHGFTEADIARVELFESDVKGKPAHVKFVPESLDFGDWA